MDDATFSPDSVTIGEKKKNLSKEHVGLQGRCNISFVNN